MRDAVRNQWAWCGELLRIGRGGLSLDTPTSGLHRNNDRTTPVTYAEKEPRATGTWTPRRLNSATADDLQIRLRTGWLFCGTLTDSIGEPDTIVDQRAPRSRSGLHTMPQYSKAAYAPWNREIGRSQKDTHSEGAVKLADAAMAKVYMLTDRTRSDVPHRRAKHETKTCQT